MAQEIFDSLAEAHRVLHDPGLRRAYVGKLGREDGEASEPPHAVNAGPSPASSRAAASPPSGAAQSLYEVGLEHLRARRHHEAVEVLRQAARLVPNEADYRAALGWALFRQAPGDARAARAAIAELRRATQIDERHRSAAQHLAEIYAQTGQPEAAIAELERLLALDPEAVELADELRRLRGAVAARSRAGIRVRALGPSAGEDQSATSLSGWRRVFTDPSHTIGPAGDRRSSPKPKRPGHDACCSPSHAQSHAPPCAVFDQPPRPGVSRVETDRRQRTSRRRGRRAHRRRSRGPQRAAGYSLCRGAAHRRRGPSPGCVRLRARRARSFKPPAPASAARPLDSSI